MVESNRRGAGAAEAWQRALTLQDTSVQLPSMLHFSE